MKRLLLTLLFIFFVTPAWGAGEITVWDATETSQHGGAYDTLAAALANAATVAGDHVILSGNAAAETTSVPTVIDDNIEIKSDTPGTKRTVSASGSIVNLLKITKTGCTVTDILFDGVTNTTSNVVWVENNLNSTAVSIRATFNNCEIQNIASGSHGIFGCSTDAGDGAVNLSINTCKFTANSTTSFGVYSYSVGGTTPIGSVTIINSIFIRPAANGITGYSTAGGVYIDAGNTGTISKSYFETPGASSGAYSLNCGIVVGVDTTANVFNNYFSTAITALTNRFSVALLDTGGTINFWGNIVNGNTAGGAVWSYGAEATDSFVVHNNTFLNCGNAFNFASTPTFASIKNNIFYGTTYPFRKETGAAPIGFGALPSAASCSNNLYYPCAAAANISDDATTVFSDAEYADATNISGFRAHRSRVE